MSYDPDSLPVSPDDEMHFFLIDICKCDLRPDQLFCISPKIELICSDVDEADVVIS